MFPDNDIRVDRSLYIRELQSALRDLHHQETGIPPVNIDGVFGPQTTAAVREAQRIGGLPDTGRVDFETWTWIFALRNDGLENAEAVELLGKVVLIDDRDNVADSVQIMLAELAYHFPNLHAPTPTGEYDPETAAAIESFAMQTQLTNDVCCEAELLRLMARLYRQYAR